MTSDAQKQKEEFERLKESLLNDYEEEQIPKTITDQNKLQILMGCDRTEIDFEREIQSLNLHEANFARPRLTQLMQSVYIPKFKVKSFQAQMYAGETAESYNNYHYSNNKMTIFADKNRSRDDVILGIESSFDESAASFVNSFGEIKANHQITQWEQWRDTDGIDPKVAEEKHKENVPKAIEECLKQYSIKKGDSRFKGIAVTVGPGQEKSLNVAINLAQKLGEEYQVPVIPVNHLEAHVLTPRFSHIHAQNKDQMPLVQFPFVTLLATGKHCEIILTRGVGLHTILGMSVDCGVGEVFDKAYLHFQKYKNVLQDEEQIQYFIAKYNQDKPENEKIPENYFDFLKAESENHSRGLWIEKLAKYGDPSEIELPLGFKHQTNADMTFTGVKTAVQSAFHVKTEDKTVPLFERVKKDLNFNQLVNYSASIQFCLLSQLKQKTQVALDWCLLNNISLNALSVSGGVSCNHELRRLISQASSKSNLPLLLSPPHLCTDNASMIAWMGWELKNAQQDVDIRGKVLNGLKKIPLGSYAEGQIHITAQYQRLLTRKQQEIADQYQEKKDRRIKKQRRQPIL